ncbi:DUF4913 domain-containing protein [Streptomyces pseudovenezuelae]|uniref:DUF4913 domain-containing protein n=1 Tax=Streptomyces pseudovenezuelae TaxID=67350 RepID=A0ABT6LQ77_9ACTN|nr:DUF4913 domain-containing protein [Streptomyces pseudovenezuelae]MDH6218467.1 hypothetical protein [Streptomyces pseudovenezuelae]
MSAISTEKPEASETKNPEAEEKLPSPPLFILYMEGPAYGQTLRQLTLWTHHVLLPVYGREVTSTSPWCPRWWDHPEAVAQLHGLWLAWGHLTGPDSEMTGPASWHRDYLSSVMDTLRDPRGPFAGCKPGMHRPKEKPMVEAIDPFGPRNTGTEDDQQ